MADDIYAFNNEGDFDRNIQSIRVTEGRSISNGAINGSDGFPLFAKITSIVDDTNDRQAKGLQVVFDVSAEGYTEFGWLFDVDDTEGDASARQGDIYSGHDMAVDDIVQVFRYKDKSDTSDWIALPIGGAGSERPIIKTAGALAFGATLVSIISQTVKDEFTETQQFRAYYPWGTTIALPDDYVFTADVDSTGAFYTEVFPQSIYVKPLESYPAAAGFDNFQIYAGATDTSTLLFDSTTSNPNGFKLLLDGFDFANASTPAKDYYENVMFPASFSIEDQDFYFISPLVGD